MDPLPLCWPQFRDAAREKSLSFYSKQEVDTEFLKFKIPLHRTVVVEGSTRTKGTVVRRTFRTSRLKSFREPMRPAGRVPFPEFPRSSPIS